MTQAAERIRGVNFLKDFPAKHTPAILVVDPDAPWSPVAVDERLTVAFDAVDGSLWGRIRVPVAFAKERRSANYVLFTQEGLDVIYRAADKTTKGFTLCIAYHYTGGLWPQPAGSLDLVVLS